MFAVIDLVLPLFGIIFLGFAAGRLMRIEYSGLDWMNFFIIYVALPAMFYKLLSSTPVEQFANVAYIAISAGATLIVFIAIFFIASLINGWNIAHSTIQGFAAAYGNIGYMGPPLAIAAFGVEAGLPVALIFCFENAMHFILAPFLMGIHAKKPKPVFIIIGEILFKIFTHPFIIATIIGVMAAIIELKLPRSIDTLINVLAAAAAPCALFVMGVSAALRPLKRIPYELGYIVPAKLIIHPLLVYFLLTVFLPDLDKVWLYSAMLLAALPSATNVFVLAQQYEAWQERASSAVVITTLLATFTVTAFLYLMLNGYL